MEQLTHKQLTGHTVIYKYDNNYTIYIKNNLMVAQTKYF